MRLEKTNLEVTLKDELTWGEAQDIEAVLVEGVTVGAAGIEKVNKNVIRDQKYKSLEICIVKIEDGDGKEIKFSKEWMNNLPQSDGESLELAVAEVIKKK